MDLQIFHNSSPQSSYPSQIPPNRRQQQARLILLLLVGCFVYERIYLRIYPELVRKGHLSILLLSVRRDSAPLLLSIASGSPVAPVARGSASVPKRGGYA